MERIFFIVLGIVLLITWNITINIATEYYIEYILKSGNDSNPKILALQNSFFNDIVIISQVFIFVIAIGSFFYRPKKGTEVYHISLSVIVLFFGFVILTILTLLDTTKWKIQFIYVHYFMISVMQVASGWMEVSLFAMAGAFQEKDNLFPSLLTGMNLCGVIATLFFVLLIVVKIGTWKLVAIYYSVAGLLCLLGLYLCMKIMSLPFYANAKSTEEEKVSLNVKVFKDLKRLIIAFKMCYPAILSTYLVYVVTLSTYPAVMRTSAPRNPNIHLTDDWYGIICSFVIFNILSFVMSPLPSYFRFPSPKYAFIPAVLRIAFIPIFIYGNSFPAIRVLPVTIPDWFFILCTIIFSLSHGYYCSLIATYAPEYAPSYEREAGFLTFIFTSAGLVSGSFASKLINYIITNQ